MNLNAKQTKYFWVIAGLLASSYFFHSFVNTFNSLFTQPVVRQKPSPIHPVNREPAYVAKAAPNPLDLSASPKKPGTVDPVPVAPDVKDKPVVPREVPPEEKGPTPLDKEAVKPDPPTPTLQVLGIWTGRIQMRGRGWCNI